MEKRLLEALIKAQKDQNNMEELQPEYIREDLLRPQQQARLGKEGRRDLGQHPRSQPSEEEESGDRLNRVYEVEEYMGGYFIDELAKLHRDHVKLQENAQAERLGRSLALNTDFEK